MSSDNRNGRSGDIPVSGKNRRNSPPPRRQTNNYRYDDLVRRENGQAPVTRQPQRRPSQNDDIYFGSNSSRQPRNTQYDYLNQFDNSSSGPRDVNVSSGRGSAQRQSRPHQDTYGRNNAYHENNSYHGNGNGGGSQRNGNEQKPKRKKKKNKFFAFFRLLILAVILLYVAGTGYLYSIFSNTEYVSNEVKENSFVSESNLKSDSRVENILLLGVDDRQNAKSSRSDTMMLVSIDKRHKKIKLTSFMRDTFVTVPGHGEDRLNSACTYGGPQLVMDTIEYNFGINIDHYMLVDFNAFKDVVNSLGGVTVKVEKREAEYINRTSRQKIDYGDAVTLNGDEALVYVRIRYLDSDFYRTQRQRKVISAIVDSAKKTSPFKLIKTGKKALGYIETDMSSMKLTMLTEGAGLSYINYDIVQTRIPFDGKYTNQTIRGMDVLVIDTDETAKLLQSFIYDESSEEELTTAK